MEKVGEGETGEAAPELVAMATCVGNCDWLSLAGEIHILGLPTAKVELRGGGEKVQSSFGYHSTYI